jgi:alkylated DNA repair protein alkB family protein 1
MGEQCRRNYHGVPRIIENTLPEYLTSSKTNTSLEEDELNYWDVIADYLESTRVNINVRQVF